MFAIVSLRPGEGELEVVPNPLGLDDIGTVAAGKSADFVVLDGNPLSNIRNTQAINRVYLRGVEVDRIALRRRFRAGG